MVSFVEKNISLFNFETFSFINIQYKYLSYIENVYFIVRRKLMHEIVFKESTQVTFIVKDKKDFNYLHNAGYLVWTGISVYEEK